MIEISEDLLIRLLYWVDTYRYDYCDSSNDKLDINIDAKEAQKLLNEKMKEYEI